MKIKSFVSIILTSALLIIANSENIFSTTKVYVALVSPYDSEPEIFNCFIAGYESAGGKWNGVFGSDTTVQNSGTVSTVLPYCVANGFDLVIRNTSASGNLIQDADPFYFQGIQIVACSGDNRYRYNTVTGEPNHIILCGAGDKENQTSYNCEFFDIHPFAEVNVTELKQTADTVIVTTDGAFVLLPGQKVNFSNIKGYSSNIDGAKDIVQFVTDSYNKFKILHKMGSGSLKPGAKVKIYFQSYSHAYIAGKLTYIKDKLNCSWWDARYRMRMTASNKGTFAMYDGYGKPDIVSALKYSGTIPNDPYNTLGNIGNITVTENNNALHVTIDSVANASKYEIYDHSTLVYSFPGINYSASPKVISRKSLSKNSTHSIWYKALRYTQQTSESERVSVAND